MTITLQGESILIHGVPKVGKTQLASSFPGLVQFITTEPGHRFIPDVQRKILYKLLPEKGWRDFSLFISKDTLLRRRMEKIKTICIDTVGGLYSLCVEEVCKRNNWQHPSDGAHGKG